MGRYRCFSRNLHAAVIKLQQKISILPSKIQGEKRRKEMKRYLKNVLLVALFLAVGVGTVLAENIVIKGSTADPAA